LDGRVAYPNLFEIQDFVVVYHPETDGQTKRINHCIKQFLCAFVHKQPSRWSKLLSWAEFHHNTTFSAATRMTLFEATYRRKPPSLLVYCVGSSALEAVNQDLTMRDAIVRQLKANLSKAQDAMKFFTDKKHEHEFQQEDLVVLKLQPFRQLSLRHHSSHKLGLRFYGPYKVLERLGPFAYCLTLPATSRIHPVFHCSLLKPYKGSTTPVIHSLSASSSTNKPVHVPIAIPQHRIILRGNKQFLRC
jgi:hypothetical protein